MDGEQRVTRTVFATAMIGLGILGLAYGDVALAWQLPGWVPAGRGLAYAAASVMFAGGIGLLFRRSAAISVRILFPCLLIWLLLKVPAVVAKPLVEANWESLGEVAVLTAGGLALLATLAGQGAGLKVATGEYGIRIARYLFAAALLAIGPSHFVYSRETAALVPAWLPVPTAWAYLTGAGHIAAGLGVLFSIYARLAAMMEAGMLTVFTILVWIPAVLSPAATSFSWSELVISWSVAAGAWVVAGSMPGKDIIARPSLDRDREGSD
jgi:uncharacterized membrane protein